jgi:hypothetical protein
MKRSKRIRKTTAGEELPEDKTNKISEAGCGELVDKSKSICGESGSGDQVGI